MRRTVVIAGIVVVALAVLPSAAFAEQLPVAAVPAQPADCPSAPRDPGGGSGTGEPATGGDGADPGSAGDEPDPKEPGSEKPGSEKPGSEKPAQPGGDEPSEQGAAAGGEGVADDEPPADDKQAGDKSDDKSGGDQSGGDQAGGGQAGDDKSAGAKSGGDQSGGDSSGDDKSGDDKSAGDPSGGDSSGDDKSGGDKAGGDKPAGDKPAGDEPAGDKPAGDKPAGDKPAGDKPAGDKPAGDKPAGDKPAGDEPAGPAAPPEPDPCAAPKAPAAPADPAAPAGHATSAAAIHKWGKPNRVENFDGDLSDWSLYDGEGHAGNGRRSPEAASTKDGLLTINGDSDGTTAGMAWNPGQKYGRWEGRVRAPQSDPSYNALLLLWPDAENFPVGGEVDFMEMTDHLRQETELFLHYGADNSQVQGEVKVDATQWHNWAVEWTPEKITAFVDGKEWWSTNDTSILPPGPMHLCVQLDWFPGGEGDVKPSEMQVDWVRQYSLPESEQQGGEKKEGLLEGAGGALDDLTRRTEGAPDPVSSGQRGASGS